MALLNDPDQLSQGTSSAESIAWTSSSGVETTLTGTGLPAIAAGEYFEIRDHSVAVNNGLYKESGGTPLTTSITADKISGSNPQDAGSEAVTWLGDSNTLAKNVMFDTAGKGIYLLEQEGLGADGVTFNAVYSFAKEEWKDDDFLKQFPFPMFAIDLDAGKYQVGTDGANNNGWTFVDNTSPAIRTRKLLRSAGWLEKDSSGNSSAIYAGIQTLGTFEDENNDTAYYQFGTDTTTDDTVDFDFAGPVDEAVLCYEEKGNPDTCTFATSTTITRATGSFIDDGYKVGGRVFIRDATTGANDGSHTVTAVAATTLTCGGSTFTTEADTSAVLAVDNRYAFKMKLRVRDGDTYGKTFDSANLASGGATALGNYLFKFPLSNVSDLKITATDAQIDANSDGAADVSPYSGMSITYYASAQTKTDLVNGSKDFGIVIDANSGTAQQVYEFVQWSLRSTGGDGTGDIDSDASTAIGRTMDDLLVFEGDTLVAGKTAPTNPDGGGSGVYITNIAASDKNNVTMYDNSAEAQTFPETVSVTLDFNDALINDTVAEYTLFFDRTIRTPNTTLTDFALASVSGSSGTITSTLGNLPDNAELSAGDYIRVQGLTAGNAAMNGIYQITAETTAGEEWAVERYDGADIVAVTSTAAHIDQNPVDSPDAIIVQDDSPADVTGLTSGGDEQFSFDFDGNTQGGRTVSTDTYVIARAIGLDGAQFVQSSVATISSGTPLTITLTASNELNYVT